MKELVITVVIEKCRDCRFWFDGHMKPICSHQDSVELASKGIVFKNGHDKYNWQLRIIKDVLVIPDWCPLKHGSNY